MSKKYSAGAIRKSYPASYLAGWIEGEIEGLPKDMEKSCKARFIEIHRAIVSKLKAGEKLYEAAKAYRTASELRMLNESVSQAITRREHYSSKLRKAIKDYEAAQ
jgi:hypothetical protein